MKHFIYIPIPEVYCRIWEDTSGITAIAEGQKFSMKGKHVSIECHPSREYLSTGTIFILPFDTEVRTSCIFSKPLDEIYFCIYERS